MQHIENDNQIATRWVDGLEEFEAAFASLCDQKQQQLQRRILQLVQRKNYLEEHFQSLYTRASEISKLRAMKAGDTNRIKIAAAHWYKWKLACDSGPASNSASGNQGSSSESAEEREAAAITAVQNEIVRGEYPWASTDAEGELSLEACVHFGVKVA